MLQIRIREALAWCVLTGLVLVGCAPGPAPPDDVGVQKTRASMDQIFAALSQVLPLSLDPERFADPAHRNEIQTALDTLASNASELEDHSRQRDAGFGNLSRSLARDARDVQRRFEEERLPEARFLLGLLTENCVACHSRLPSPRTTGLGRQLLDDSEVASLPPAERVWLEVATRQFDDALDTYEEIFLAEDALLAKLDLEGHFTDYLVVCIRVKGELVRPRRLFEELLQRNDLPLYLRQDLTSWVRALWDLGSRTAEGSELDQARALVLEARTFLEFPTDQTALIHYLVASGLLHRYVNSRAHQGEDVAEAYYLLGVTESRTNPFFWLSQAEFFLETSIRLAPKATFSERAYALLEEHTIAGYSGSSGIHIPEDVRQRLRDLRSLMNASGPAQPRSDAPRAPSD